MFHYWNKPKIAYENMWIYCIITVVNFLHVAITFCGQFQRHFYEGFITKTNKLMYKYKLLNFKYVIQNIC